MVASGLKVDQVAQTIAEKYKAVKENLSVSVAHHEIVPGFPLVTSLKHMGKFLASSSSYFPSIALVPIMDNPQWLLPVEEVVGGLLGFPFDKGGTDGFPPPGA